MCTKNTTRENVKMLHLKLATLQRNPQSALQSLNKNSASAVAAHRGLIRDKDVSDLMTAKDSTQRTM